MSTLINDHDGKVSAMEIPIKSEPRDMTRMSLEFPLLVTKYVFFVLGQSSSYCRTWFSRRQRYWCHYVYEKPSKR